MCGINGIIDFSNHFNTKDNINRMNISIKHRGPDQKGILLKDNIALGHVRLSIIDLSNNGKQPMSDDNNIIDVVFNGEIYNFKSIKKKLDEFNFNSKTDTETIIYGYKKYGLENLINRFNGMFAFCLWDSEKQEGYLVRDRFGQKPLYYTIYDNALIFSSEIKSILSLNLIKRDVDKESLFYYLSFLSTPAPKTLFKNIFKVPSGHYLKISKNEIKLVKYFDINNNFNIDYSLVPSNKLINKVEDYLKESIRIRQMSDVPQGIFLSGGVDSSLLVALNSKISKKPVKTFSITFNDNNLDEEKYSDMVAKQYNTDHHKELLNESKMYDALDSIIYYEDEPIADPVNLPLYYLSKMTKNKGVTVVHTGEGADELFCGYKYYEILNKTYNYFRLLNKFEFISRPIISILPKSKNTLKYAAKYFIDSKISSRNIMGFYDNEKDFVRQRDYSCENKLKEFTKYNSINKNEFFFDLRSTEFKLRLPELLFMRLDKFSMANSLEARAPFLDLNLMNLSFSIPATTHLYKNTPKYILKKVSEHYLSHDLIYRNKIGFGAPLQDFFNYYSGNLKKSLNLDFMKKYFYVDKYKKLIRNKDKKNNHFKLWALLNFSLWYDRWIYDQE